MKVKESYYHEYDTPISRVVRDESYDFLCAYAYAPPKIRFNIHTDGVMSNNTFMFKIFQYLLKESSQNYSEYDFNSFLSSYGDAFSIYFPETEQNVSSIIEVISNA